MYHLNPKMSYSPRSWAICVQLKEETDREGPRRKYALGTLGNKNGQAPTPEESMLLESANR